jgi:hypothetical protein
MPSDSDSKRHVTRIQFDSDRGEWRASNFDQPVKTGNNKKRLVSEVAEELQQRWRDSGQPGQLVVHTKEGGIEFERTYGRDPERTPG